MATEYEYGDVDDDDDDDDNANGEDKCERCLSFRLMILNYYYLK